MDVTSSAGLILLFFDISGGELLIILLVAFLVFGPSKLPELARKIGKGMNEVRRASDEIKREISKESRKLENSVNTDSAWGKDFQKTADDISHGLDDAARTKPGARPKDDLKTPEDTASSSENPPAGAAQ